MESLRKFTLSFACFIFFFIGAPLGAIIRKGGLGTPVIVSALFFVLYWVVDISGKKLARDGVISPAIGAFVSSMVLLPIGIFLTWKSTKDSSMFNMETYLLPVQKFFKRIFNGKRNSRSADVSNMGRKLRIVYMGTSDFATEPLRTLIGEGYNVAGVVTVPDRKSGRGQKLVYSPVKQYILSLEQDIPLLQPESLKDPGFLESLKKLNADLFIVVAFRMLPKAVWSMPPLGTFNLHASLLPRYRGAAPINRAIMNGETETGVTTFLLDENIDTGGILFQRRVGIDPEDNYESLHDKLMNIGANLVPYTVEAIAREEVHLKSQEEMGIEVGENQRYAPKLSRETGKIDWNRSAAEIHNLIRGLSPKPGAYSVLQDDENEMNVKILASVTVTDEAVLRHLSGSLPGTVYTDSKTLFCVKCGEGALSVTELQAPGRKRLRISSFLAGRRGEGGFFK